MLIILNIKKFILFFVAANTMGSPKKSSAMDSSNSLNPNGWSSKPRKSGGVAPMPVLSAIQRSSATSVGRGRGDDSSPLRR